MPDDIENIKERIRYNLRLSPESLKKVLERTGVNNLDQLCISDVDLQYAGSSPIIVENTIIIQGDEMAKKSTRIDTKDILRGSEHDPIGGPEFTPPTADEFADKFAKIVPARKKLYKNLIPSEE
jgi:hypothetical protein